MLESMWAIEAPTHCGNVQDYRHFRQFEVSNRIKHRLAIQSRNLPKAVEYLCSHKNLPKNVLAYTARTKTSGTILTLLNLTRPQRPNHGFLDFHQMCSPTHCQWEKLLTWLLPSSAELRPVATSYFHLPESLQNIQLIAFSVGTKSYLHLLSLKGPPPTVPNGSLCSQVTLPPFLQGVQCAVLPDGAGLWLMTCRQL